MSLEHIPHIVPVLSGKGGVGKSSVTVQLALALCLAGRSVGVLDIDLTGPSIPRLLGVEQAKIKQAPGGWLPVQVHEAVDEAAAAAASASENQTVHATGALHCLSLGFLLRDRGDAVVWRGPKKTAMVKQLLSDVQWPRDLDVLLIDTPPGTSDEHISLVTELLGKRVPSTRLAAVVVTTPQRVAVADVRKELSFCRTVGLPVVGVVENMAGFVCPCCGETTHIFQAPTTDELADEAADGPDNSVLINDTANKMTDETTNKAANARSRDIGNKLADEAANKMADDLANKWADQMSGRMADEMTDKMADELYEDMKKELAERQANEWNGDSGDSHANSNTITADANSTKRKQTAKKRQQQARRRQGGGERMALEWRVPLLASVPLDGEGWGMLVEQGRRPVYSRAVAQEPGEVGEVLTAEEQQANDSNPDPGRLVDKYTDCRLYAIFKQVAGQVLDGEAVLPTPPAS